MGKGRQWELALHMLAHMADEGCTPDRPVLRAALNSCRFGAQWVMAIQLMQTLLDSQNKRPQFRRCNVKNLQRKAQALQPSPSDNAAEDLSPEECLTSDMNAAVAACEQ